MNRHHRGPAVVLLVVFGSAAVVYVALGEPLAAWGCVFFAALSSGSLWVRTEGAAEFWRAINLQSDRSWINVCGVVAILAGGGGVTLYLAGVLGLLAGIGVLVVAYTAWLGGMFAYLTV